MSNYPDISADTFNKDKFWQQVILKQGSAITDSDFNEAQSIQRYRDWLTVVAAVGLDSRIGAGFEVSEAAVPLNNLYIGGGLAIVHGSIILTNGDRVLGSGQRAFSLEPTPPTYTNRITDGVVTAVDAANHVIIDSEKNWVPEHLLSGCRVVMTSGRDAGAIFTVNQTYGTGWDSTSVTVTATSFNVQAGDTYVIVPPRLTTPSLGALDRTRTDLVYLQTWYEYINRNEDSDIGISAWPEWFSDRVKLCWCVRVSEGYYDSSTSTVVAGTLPVESDTDDPFGVHYMALATLTRPHGESRVLAAQISNYRGVEVPLPALSQEMVDARTSEWFGDYTSLDNRLDAAEGAIRDTKLFNGSFELGSSVGADIPGWLPSSTAWSIAASGARHQSKCAVVDHTSRPTARTETLISYPVYIRPGQKLKLVGSVRGGNAGCTIQVIFEGYANTNAWDSAVQTQTLSFGSGSTDWTANYVEFDAGPTVQAGRVRLVTENQSGVSVYFDDIRLEYLEETMSNTTRQLAMAEIFSGRFGEDLRGWHVDQRYANTANVEVLADNLYPVMRMTPTGSITAIEVNSWPVNIGNSTILDTSMVLQFEGRYSDLRYGVSEAGAYAYVKFYDANFNEITTSNAPIYLTSHDWGTSSTNPVNPGGTSFNTYTGILSVPPNTAVFTVHLGLSSTAGYAEFKSIRVLRWGSALQVDANKMFHDLAANGEFGRGMLASDLSDADKADPATGSFEIINWTVTGEDTDTQIVHWVKNSPIIAAPVGDRVLELSVPATEVIAGEGVKVLQVLQRTLTVQDYIHGFVLDFDYMHENVPADASVELQLEFLDSSQVVVGDITRISLVGALPSTDGWEHKVVGVSPPTRILSENPELQIYKAPVYLRYGFRVVVPTPSATETVARIAAVHVWGRTVPAPLNPISDAQYAALKGYYTHDTPGYTKEDSYYESGLMVPGEDNPFLTAKDRDLMRYTRLHAHRHVPAATDAVYEDIPEDQNADPIPVASALQTGLLSSTEFVNFLRRSELASVWHVGIHEGLYVDEYAKVWPGVAIDKNNHRLEIATATQMAIVPDQNYPYNQNHIDIVYIQYDPSTNGAKLGMLTGQYDADAYYMPNVAPFAEGGSLSDAIILAIGLFDEVQYRGEIADLTEEELALYKKHWAGLTVDESFEPPQEPEVTPTYPDGYLVYNSPIEYLYNAQQDGITETLREPLFDPASGERIIPSAYEPRYRVTDCRLSAYRIIRMRDADLIMLYAIAPNAYEPDDVEASGYLSVPFNEFGNTEVAPDIGWDDGYPLRGAFEHWDDFLDTYKTQMAALKGYASADDWDSASKSIKDIMGTATPNDAVPITLTTINNELAPNGMYKIISPVEAGAQFADSVATWDFGLGHWNSLTSGTNLTNLLFIPIIIPVASTLTSIDLVFYGNSESTRGVYAGLFKTSLSNGTETAVEDYQAFSIPSASYTTCSIAVLPSYVQATNETLCVRVYADAIGVRYMGGKVYATTYWGYVL